MLLGSVFSASVQDERGNMRGMLRDRARERLGKRGRTFCAEARNSGFILKTSEGLKEKAKVTEGGGCLARSLIIGNMEAGSRRPMERPP